MFRYARRTHQAGASVQHPDRDRSVMPSPALAGRSILDLEHLVRLRFGERK